MWARTTQNVIYKLKKNLVGDTIGDFWKGQDRLFVPESGLSIIYCLPS